MYDPLDHTLCESASQYGSVSVAGFTLRKRKQHESSQKPDNYVIYVKYFLCVFQKMRLYTTAE